MSTKYKLVFLTEFYQELEGILRYISGVLKNPIAADKFLLAVKNAIQERLENPTAFQQISTTKPRRFTYYRINVKNYVVIYVVRGDVMEVRRIVYARRNLSFLLS